VTPPDQQDELGQLGDAALMAVGKTIYASNCAPCHRPNGEGNLSIIPALNRNAIVTVSDPIPVIDTVLHGREVMPAFEVTLSAREVAAVLSYIRNAWNNQASVVSEGQVRAAQDATTSE
jgi:cytochrome c oxidase subunit 2